MIRRLKGMTKEEDDNIKYIRYIKKSIDSLEEENDASTRPSPRSSFHYLTDDGKTNGRRTRLSPLMKLVLGSDCDMFSEVPDELERSNNNSISILDSSDQQRWSFNSR